MQWNWGGFPMVWQHTYIHSQTHTDVDVLLLPAAYCLWIVMLTHCLKLLSLPSPSQLCQSERTPVELQRSSGSSHFRTIERQDSFDMGYGPVISCGRVGSVTVVRPQPRTHSLDLGSQALQNTPLFKEKNSHIAHSTPSDLSKSSESSEKTNVGSTPALESTLGEEDTRDSSFYSANLINGTDLASTASVEHISSVTENSVVGVIEPNNAQKQLIKDSEDCTVTAASPASTELSNPQQQGALLEQSEQGSASSAPVSEGDSGIDPCAEGGEEEGGPGGTEGSAGGSLTNRIAPKAEGRDSGISWTTAEGNSSEASSKVEQQDKKKGTFLSSLIYVTF